MNKRNMPVFIVGSSMDGNEISQPALGYLLRSRKYFAGDSVPTQISDSSYETTPYPIQSDDVYASQNNRFYKLLVD